SPGGAALTGATGLCGREVWIRRIAPPSGKLPRWRCAYRGYGVVRSGSLDKAHRAAIRETPPVALGLPGLQDCAVRESG
ncbi:TPA: hypothetical protein ACNU9X_005524, partial [Raoultella ornithinolytica]